MTSSIANETVDHSKNREPFSFYKFITNKYYLNEVSIVLFLALWDYVAKEKIFRDSLARPLEVVDQLGLQVAALTARSNVDLMEQQARIYSEHLEEQNDPQREYRQKGTADTFTGGTEW